MDVDLPAPFGPMNASRSPASTSNEMDRTASTGGFFRPPAKTFVSPSTTTAPIRTCSRWGRGEGVH